VSQSEVERTLGRLLTDAAFRAEFFREPGRTCLQLGLQLASGEMAALLRVPRAVLANLGSRLDDRICRLFLCTASIRYPMRQCRPRPFVPAGTSCRGGTRPCLPLSLW